MASYPYTVQTYPNTLSGYITTGSTVYYPQYSIGYYPQQIYLNAYPSRHVCYPNYYTVATIATDEDQTENELDLNLCCSNCLFVNWAIQQQQFNKLLYMAVRGDVFIVPGNVIDAVSFYNWVQTNPEQIEKEPAALG